MLDNKKARFRDAEWFKRADEFTTPIIIGGAGGIGSWLTMLLSRAINPNVPIYIFDYDRVEEVNIVGQIYGLTDINKLKTDALVQIVKRNCGATNIISQNAIYGEDSLSSPIMFSAFDNMKARKAMFNNWKKEAAKNPDSIFIDGRLLAEQFQVFFVTPNKISEYEKYLFDDSEVESENCSYKQTSHFAANIAAKMVQGFTNWFVKDTVELPFYYEEIGSLFLSTIKES